MSITRFTKAQQGSTYHRSYQQAYQELQQGKKETDWIWYIFPQLKVLGRSDAAKHFGIVDLEEACAYLQDEKLFKNYFEILLLVKKQLETIPAQQLMSKEIDVKKLVSSLTLFQEAARLLAQRGYANQDYPGLAECCSKVLAELEKQNYLPCQTTLQFIDSTERNHQVPYDDSSMGHTKPSSKQDTNGKDLSQLSQALDNYITTRESEWGFHYNFFYIMSWIYWLEDTLLGTDFYNPKSKEIKINAALHLKEMIEGQNTVLPETEKKALREGRLGELVDDHGGIEYVISQIEAEKSSSYTPT